MYIELIGYISLLVVILVEGEYEKSYFIETIKTMTGFYISQIIVIGNKCAIKLVRYL